jgi:nucleoside-diphosphate-sugar epimerase
VKSDAPLQRNADFDRFSASIAATEDAILDAGLRGAFHATVVRYPLIYGPRQLAPREWSIIRRIQDGRRRIVLPDNGLALRSRGHAANMAKALLLIMERASETSGTVLNISDERVLSLREWATCIAAEMGAQIEWVNLPWELALPARPYAPRPSHFVMDIDHLLSLGYRDQMSALEAIAHTARWYRENPIELGGQEETQLRDSFDYAAEDALMDAFDTTQADVHLAEAQTGRRRYLYREQ